MSPSLNALIASTPVALRDYTGAFYENAFEEDLKQLSKTTLSTIADNHYQWAKAFKKGGLVLHFNDDVHEGVTSIDLISEDLAFIVDSVAAALSALGHEIGMMIHPRLLQPNSKTGHHLSHMHVVLGKKLAPAQQAIVAAELKDVMRDVTIANKDWRPMKTQLRQWQQELAADEIVSVPNEERKEYADFLDYLADDNFTLLGYREYAFDKKGKSKIVSGASLGLLDNEREPVFVNNADISLPEELQHIRKDLPLIYISKVNRRSTVHRRVPLDCISIRRYNKKGEVIGEGVFIGLFTSVTYSRSLRSVPYLRWKAEKMLDKAHFTSGTHDHRALRHILERYPRDELFQIDLESLFKICMSILRLQERKRVSLYVRPDIFGRYVSCLVYVPRDQFDTRLRLQFQRIMEEELGGECTNYYSSIDDSMLVRLLFIITVPPFTKVNYNQNRMEERLQSVARSWPMLLQDSLLARYPDDEAMRLFHRYENAFPSPYIERYNPEKVPHDIAVLENVLQRQQIVFYLYMLRAENKSQLRLKVYNPHQPVALSAIMPILENLGLWVVTEEPFSITMPDHAGDIWIQDFWINVDEKIVDNLDMKHFHGLFEDALQAVWHGAAENDALNQLILTRQMSWRQVALLRSFVRYAGQIQHIYAVPTLTKALCDYPDIAQALIHAFTVRHDPDFKGKREDAQEESYRQIHNLLQDVPNLDIDRMLRLIVHLIKASLRTNYFQKQPHGTDKSYIATKFDSQKIPELPDPKPFREIFVYSPKVEAVHLRFDRIARGGIRWSDRGDDFRTEVLGLVKAQQVKNSIIVPMGAKGGFFVKKPPLGNDRNAYQQEGISCYKIFIQGLLDITDNRVNGKILPPRDVVCHDEADPYLVVAADKGTATFSDTANSLSIANNFWLGDAFASGGSAGYDHKKMGITAKGAWEAVKRHFRELNHDTQSTPFTTIGVGDMGGDVFGNAMLLSKHIRMIGAFNHVHIFCDPAPDEASSFKERQRLFREVKGWDHYDTKLLSRGGRIFNRADKTLKLTPEIMKAFGIETDSCTPPDLIQAMLRTKVDLLFFGGIGTYIKSSAETHMDVGDKANNALRVNADEINARVIGEGANLGITQRGRIALARKGVLLNTDFIDNSAGVDTSDHEVNIKILLRDAITARKLAEKDRDKLLASMTADVEALVLRDNYQQTQAISLMSLRAPAKLPRHVRLMHALTDIGLLDRAVEYLPDDETCNLLQQQGKGLTRPEIATLQAYAKIQLTRELLASDVPDQPDMTALLISYFPPQLQTKFKSQILAHQLHREIIATALANQIVNRAGSAFVNEVASRTGFTLPVIVQAFLLIAQVYDLNTLWADIEKLDGKVPAADQLQAFASIAALLEQDVCWLLRRYGGNIKKARDVLRIVPQLAKLQGSLAGLLPPMLAEDVAQASSKLERAGFPTPLAQRIAQLPVIAHGCDIIRLSEQHKCDLLTTGALYFTVDRVFHLSWLQAECRSLQVTDSWDERVVVGLVESFLEARSDITAHVLTDKFIPDQKGKKAAELDLTQWITVVRPQAQIVQQRLDELRRYPTLSLPMLLSAEQELRKLT